MGLRFRKSIHVGKFFRINISKSGIGYSYGVKGARLTKKAKGGVRSTLSVPGTGISYVKDSKKHNKSAKTVQKEVVESNNTTLLQCENDVGSNLNSCQLQKLVNRIKRAFLLPKILMWAAVIFVIGLYYAFKSEFSPVLDVLLLMLDISLFIAGLVLSKSDNVCLEYEIEEDCTLDSENIQQKVQEFCNAVGAWVIESVEITYKKHKGNFAKLSRKKLSLSNKTKSPIKTNVKFLSLRSKRKEYLFLPDTVMVFAGWKFAVISYSDLKLQQGKKQIREPMPGTKGAKVVGTTWAMATKTGERDRRYSDNEQLAVCEYGLMCLYTEKGFELNILSTNTDFEENIKV